MIILNLDLGTELEREFYERIKDKEVSYLEYVERLIKEDLKMKSYFKEESENNFATFTKEGNFIPL